MEPRPPVLIITSVAAFDTIQHLAGTKGLLVPGREPEVARRLDEIEAGIVRIA